MSNDVPETLPERCRRLAHQLVWQSYEHQVVMLLRELREAEERGRASLGLPDVGEPDRSGTYPVWRHDVDCFVELSTDKRDNEPIDVAVDAPLSPERARWLAAALLAAAEESERAKNG